ncbi:MAG: hypothetical protein ACRCYU_23510 [Nocardioides sp.]
MSWRSVRVDDESQRTYVGIALIWWEELLKLPLPEQSNPLSAAEVISTLGFGLSPDEELSVAFFLARLTAENLDAFDEEPGQTVAEWSLESEERDWVRIALMEIFMCRDHESDQSVRLLSSAEAFLTVAMMLSHLAEAKGDRFADQVGRLRYELIEAAARAS